MIRAFLVLIFLSLVWFYSCEGSLELLLSSYQNPSHQLENGLCCDSVATTVCHLDPCDTTLTLCITSLASHNSAVTVQYLKEESYRRLKCPAGWSTVNLGLVSVNSDNVSFPQNGWINQHKGIKNPLTLAGDEWKEGFKLLVLVSDFDFIKHELVSVLAADWDHQAIIEDFPPSPHFARSITRGDASLTVSARVQHKKGYKGTKGLFTTTTVSTEPPSELLTEAANAPSSEQATPEGSTHSPTTTTTQAIESENTQTSQESTTTITQAMQGAPTDTKTTTQATTRGSTTQTPEEVMAVNAPPNDVGSVFKSANEATSSDDPVGSNRVAGGIVGGVLGTILLTILSVLLALLCVSCLKKKGRDDQVRLTGNADSEVTALRVGPMNNPTYTEISPPHNSSSSYNFNNSLYGALSEGMSHGSHISPPPPREPIDSQYSQITRENLENADSLEDSGSYTQIPTEHSLPKGYSVISREHMEDEGYSVVKREDDETTGGYSVVTRENLEEASDSEEEPSHNQGTSKLLLSSSDH